LREQIDRGHKCREGQRGGNEAFHG
jgi:hypothetical protein